MKKFNASKRFIKLLMNGSFRKPYIIKREQLSRKKYNDKKELENYKFFMNTSGYDMIDKVKVKKYMGDNEY